MAVLKAVSLVLFALFCFSSSYGYVMAQEDFDFYYFSLMWPGSYCNQNKGGCCLPTTCPAPAQDFFITGLITFDKFTEQPVTKCDKSNFYIKKLEDLYFPLSLYWNNVRCPSTNGVSLWRSSWKTYGVCSNLTQEEYFNTALELRKKVDLLPTLLENGIVPTTKHLYELDHIKRVIEKSVGATVHIQCSKEKSGELWQLYRVYVCVDKDGSTIISCPANSKYTCGNRLSFPPFTYDMLNRTTPNTTTTTTAAGIIKMLTE